MKDVVRALAAVQVLDVVGNAVVPRRVLARHLDHLGVPVPVRRLLQPVKVASTVGLLAGGRFPRLGQVTAAALVSYYSAAVTFHVRAGDHPVVAVPAASCGAAAAAALGTFSAGARGGARPGRGA